MRRLGKMFLLMAMGLSLIAVVYHADEAYARSRQRSASGSEADSARNSISSGMNNVQRGANRTVTGSEQASSPNVAVKSKFERRLAEEGEAKLRCEADAAEQFFGCRIHNVKEDKDEREDYLCVIDEAIAKLNCLKNFLEAFDDVPTNEQFVPFLP
jgi:cbb3-type cytochrome oxidase subunit 3